MTVLTATVLACTAESIKDTGVGEFADPDTDAESDADTDSDSDADADADADADTNADADADADADDTGTPCDSALGTVLGEAIADFSWEDDGPRPSPGARIYATDGATLESIETVANEEGHFVFPLPASVSRS